MYFEPVLHDGVVCRDGGLTENNPLQIAVEEARKIWGTHAPFDLITSLGCGMAKKAQSPPASAFIIHGWVNTLFKTLIETMNGHKAWVKFSRGPGKDMLDRCVRLNVWFQTETEPELDDVDAIPQMKSLGQSYNFYYQPREGKFTPVSGQVEGDALDVLANRHKASLYFFELNSITYNNEVAIVEGWICCRLQPSRLCHKQLIGQTGHFRIIKQTVDMPQLGDEERLKLKVSFQQQASQNSEPLRIDVKFNRVKYYVSISGFPLTLKVRLLLEYLI